MRRRRCESRPSAGQEPVGFGREVRGLWSGQPAGTHERREQGLVGGDEVALLRVGQLRRDRAKTLHRREAAASTAGWLAGYFGEDFSAATVSWHRLSTVTGATTVTVRGALWAEWFWAAVDGIDAVLVGGAGDHR